MSAIFYMLIGMSVGFILEMIINKNSTLLTSYQWLSYENKVLNKTIKALRKKVKEHEDCLNAYYEASLKDGEKLFKIVLTIAHLDHDPTNNNPSNLRALCQKCHNNYDKEHRAETRRKTLETKRGQMWLLKNK